MHPHPHILAPAHTSIQSTTLTQVKQITRTGLNNRGKTAARDKKPWWVYCFGEINIRRLDLKVSRLRFELITSHS